MSSVSRRPGRSAMTSARAWSRRTAITASSTTRKGYSGVALYTRKAPRRVVYGLDWDVSTRRAVTCKPISRTIASCRCTSPPISSEARQQAKFAFLDRFLPVLAGLRQEGREYLLCGDWNIAHRPMDLKNWRANQEELRLPARGARLARPRVRRDRLGGRLRVVNAEPEQYTWWSNRGQAWAKNVGWRIDYQIVTPALAGTIRSARIYKDGRFSDHAPLTGLRSVIAAGKRAFEIPILCERIAWLSWLPRYEPCFRSWGRSPRSRPGRGCGRRAIRAKTWSWSNRVRCRSSTRGSRES